MAGIAAPFLNITDLQLSSCIALVKGVSYQANNYEFTNQDIMSIRQIRRLMGWKNNWWATWFFPLGAFALITACCFFQRLRTRNSKYVNVYGLCALGLRCKPTPTVRNFLNSIAGNANGDNLLG